MGGDCWDRALPGLAEGLDRRGGLQGGVGAGAARSALAGLGLGGLGAVVWSAAPGLPAGGGTPAARVHGVYGRDSSISGVEGV